MLSGSTQAPRSASALVSPARSETTTSSTPRTESMRNEDEDETRADANDVFFLRSVSRKTFAVAGYPNRLCPALPMLSWYAPTRNAAIR